MNSLVFYPIPDGYRVRFQHVSDPKALEFYQIRDKPPPKFITFADLFKRDNENAPWRKVAEAMSRCSHRDTPSKQLGRLIAQNRVLVNFFGRGVFRSGFRK